MKTPVYLDHHATTPCDPRVLEAMLPHFTERFGNANARNTPGRSAARAIDRAREQLATLVGGPPESIHFTPSASASNHWALTASGREPGRDELCISALEHDSVVDAAKATGLTVRVIPVTEAGFITEDALDEVLSARTAIVSVMAANHEIGTIQPILALAARSHAAGALFHCDATQAVGRVPLDLSSVDLLTFTAHKLYGPQGIGALRVGRSCRVTPPHGGTPPLALAVGFGEACELVSRERERDAARMTVQAATLLEALGDLAFRLNGAPTPRLPGSLSLRIPDLDAEELMLDCASTLSLSTGAACASKTRTPSRVLRAIGLTDREIAGSLRIALGRFTTDDEARFAGETIREAVMQQRSAR